MVNYKEYKCDKWDKRFMDVAELVATWSKDRSTQVGSVIVKDKVIISTGYNGFPRGINDNIEERHERPTKYQFVCHAEENAIYNAARIGAKISDSNLYVTLHPCSGCAKAIIQSQIKRVIVLSAENHRWTEDFDFANKLFNEVGIDVIHMESI